MTGRIVSLALALIVCSSFAAATVDRVGPAVMPDSYAARSYSPPPLRLAEALAAQPVMNLPPANVGAVDQLNALMAWNAAGKLPLRNGFARPLPESHQVRLAADVLDSADFSSYSGGYVAPSLHGNLVWGTVVSVEAAFRLRLHLTNINLPLGTRFWVYGVGEAPIEFGLELVGPDQDLWTPSIGGDWLFLEVAIPGTVLKGGPDFRFGFSEVVEIVKLNASGAVDQSGAIAAAVGECLIDATCIDESTLDVIEPYRHAVAHLQFVDGGDGFICSGGLLNDTDPAGFIPYLLTANHCFSTQAAASTLEAFWDYFTANCGGAFPDPATKPRSQGGTLLATGAGSDFTFLRLNNVPSGRVFLGWTSTLPVNNTVLHRIAHPFGLPQFYSRSRVRTSGVNVCNGAPRPQFLYGELINGASFSGSSGSPVILTGGFVVGQLLGACGGDDGCDYSNSQIDGSFATTFPAVQLWLMPPTGSSPCTPSDTILCIDDQPGDRRFEVTMQYSNPFESGFGHSIPLLSVGVTKGGMFWIGDSANPEMLIKVLNACIPLFGNKFWVFYAATTNQGLVTTVRDTTTGAVWTRTNPQGTAAAPVQDTAAFSCN